MVSTGAFPKDTVVCAQLVQKNLGSWRSVNDGSCLLMPPPNTWHLRTLFISVLSVVFIVVPILSFILILPSIHILVFLCFCEVWGKKVHSFPNSAAWTPNRQFCFSKSALLRCLYWVFGLLFDLNCTIFSKFFTSCLNFFSFFYKLQGLFFKAHGNTSKFFQDAGKVFTKFSMQGPWSF